MIPSLKIDHLEEITPAWLSSVLQRAGVLNNERVDSIQYEPNEAFNSQVAHLQVSYLPKNRDELPERLLVKLNQAGDGMIEVEFYRQAAHLSHELLPMIVPCYSAQYDPASGASCLLLKDFSPSHQPPVTRQALTGGDGVPDVRILESIIEALAAFHAYWGEKSCCGEAAQLTRIRDWFASSEQHALHIERRASELEYFISAAGKAVSAATIALLESALRRLPDLWDQYLHQRTSQYSNLTLSHGDCYLTQFLVPRQPGSGPVLVVDFDSASGNLAAFDLVYLMATFWTRKQRQEIELEKDLLHRYYEGLVAGRVDHYTWENLLLDYRLMLAYMVFDPVADVARGSRPSYWQPKLSCLVDAYQDWECQEL